MAHTHLHTMLSRVLAGESDVWDLGEEVSVVLPQSVVRWTVKAHGHAVRGGLSSIDIATVALLLAALQRHPHCDAVEWSAFAWQGFFARETPMLPGGKPDQFHACYRRLQAHGLPAGIHLTTMRRRMILTAGNPGADAVSMDLIRLLHLCFDQPQDATGETMTQWLQMHLQLDEQQRALTAKALRKQGLLRTNATGSPSHIQGWYADQESCHNGPWWKDTAIVAIEPAYRVAIIATDDTLWSDHG